MCYKLAVSHLVFATKARTLDYPLDVLDSVMEVRHTTKDEGILE
jgi:hypothetical protein